jgi:membrane protein YqaA with SNARE-associated domain
VRSLFGSLLAYFLTTPGLVVLAALDSSLIFFLPLGIDVVLILLAARHPDLLWLYAVAATLGSVAGAAGTYWLGHKLGEAGLARWVSPSRLTRIQERISRSAAPAVAILAIIPPPFPFTAFVLTSGAVALDVWRFFSALAVVRLLRFGAEATLAARYGRRIIGWMDSPLFETVVGALAVLAVVGTAISAVAAIKSTRIRAKPS